MGDSAARLIDLSHPLCDGMPVYPGDDPVRIQQTRTVEHDGYTYFRLETGMHAGTHLDAPLHMVSGGVPISGLPLETFTGRGCLLDVRGQPVIEYKPEYVQLVHPGDIVLLWTDHSRLFGTEEYFAQHPVVSDALAEFFAARGIKMLGMDLPSPDRAPFGVHRRLLGVGIPLLENLANLDALQGEKSFEVTAFPLKVDVEGCPVRVVARVMPNALL